MKKFSQSIFAILSLAAVQPVLAAESLAQTPAATQDIAVKRGQMLYTASGQAAAPVYRITAAGEPQVMLDGQLITVPAATLSMSGAKLATSLSIPELRRLGRR